MALIYDKLGNYPKSLEFYNKALKSMKSYDKTYEKIPVVYMNLGKLYNSLNQPQEALKHLEEAKKFYKSKDKEEIYVYLYGHMAMNHRLLNQTEQSIQYAQKALVLSIKFFGEKHINTASSYNNLGNYYKENLDYIKSLEAFRRAQTIYNQISASADKLRLAEFHQSFGSFYYEIENYTKSYRYHKKAYTLAQELLLNTQVVLNREENIQYKRKMKAFMDKLLLTTFHEQNSTHIQYAFEEWINYKRSISITRNPKIFMRNPKSQDCAYIYNHISTLLSAEYKKPDVNTDTFQKLKLQKSEIEKRLTHYINPSEYEITQLDILNQLNPHELYIDFAKTDGHYIAFSLSKEHNLSIHRLDSAKIDKTINELDRTMKSIANRNHPDIKAVQSLLYKLYQDIFDTIKIPEDITTLTLSTDAQLGSLAFGMLYDSQHYLIERYTLHYVSSAKEFIKSSHNKRASNKRASNKRAIIIGAPNFDGESNQTTRALPLPHFDPLKGAKKEAQSIYQILLGHYHPTLWIDENASIENFQCIKSPAILHIATHGIYQDKDSNIDSQLKSSLALANINRFSQKGSNYGLINAFDLAKMNFHDTKLVTLSVCQSGRGDSKISEGVVSIGSAFLEAGSKHVLMSLWRVDDEATPKLMKSFYQNLLKSEDYAKHLRHAKIKMLKNPTYAHPYYWAPFILMGR